MPRTFLKMGQADLTANGNYDGPSLSTNIALREVHLFPQERRLQEAKISPQKEWSQRACLFRNIGRTLCPNDLFHFDQGTIAS